MVVAYVPVLHRGYRNFFEKYRDAKSFLLFGEELIKESDYLHKEIRALDPQDASSALQAWRLGPTVAVATLGYLKVLNASKSQIVMPDEDVCRQVAKKHLPDCTITFDSIFLRWNRENVLQEKELQADRTMLVTDLDGEFMSLAAIKAEHSSDWWRQVGAVAAREGEVLLTAYNHHLPSPHTPYVDGDPRNAFSKGVNIELGTALHAEKGIICEAARQGIALEGAYLYVTTFPCPPCAKAIVAAGFKRCYYSTGYAMLDGETILKQSGVEIIHVSL